jgi:hypothetical protein
MAIKHAPSAVIIGYGDPPATVFIAGSTDPFKDSSWAAISDRVTRLPFNCVVCGCKRLDPIRKGTSNPATCGDPGCAVIRRKAYQEHYAETRRRPTRENTTARVLASRINVLCESIRTKQLRIKRLNTEIAETKAKLAQLTGVK